MIKFIITCCLLFVATFFCLGQSVQFKAVVLNEDNIALPNVSVTAKQNNLIKTYSVTDNKGFFSLTLAAGQKYLLQLSSIGYKKFETELTITENPKVQTYTLTKQVNTIDTVKITAKRGYYERGDTIFYNTDVYKRNNENNLKDLLNNLPGVEVNQQGRITVDGQQVSKVLIDGKDLTGDDYEKIVNNLSPHGLDQVQVLKKYKDPFKLSESFTGDTEIAINLTFKKKRLIPSAKFSLSLGLPVDYFEQKTDFLITSKHITGLCFANWNTIGNTHQFVVPPKEILGSYRSGDFNKLGRGLQYFNRVNELFLPITKNLYSFNNTKYFDNSSQVNFSKNTTDKFTITYSPEKVEQAENSFVQTYNGSQLLSETKSLRNPVLKNERFAVKNELIWMVKRNRQVKIESSYQKENNLAVNDGLLNNKNTLFNTNNSKTTVTNLINYTTYLKRNRLFNAALFYDYAKIDEQLATDGVAYNGALFSTAFGTTQKLQQKKLNDEHNAGGYLKLIKHKNDYSVTVQPTYRFLSGKFYSQLNAASVTGFQFNNIDSFNNGFRYFQNSFSLPVRYKYSDVHDILNLSIDIEPFVLLQQKFHTVKRSAYSGFNAIVDIRHTFKNKKALSIRANKGYQMAAAEQLLQSNIIKGNTNIQVKSGLITNAVNYNISATFFNKTFNKKFKNTYSIGYRVNDPDFIFGSTNNNLYTVYSYMPFSNINTGHNAAVRNELTISALKLRLEQSVMFTASKYYALQNQQLVRSTSKNFTFDNKVKSRFDRTVNFDWSNSLSYSNSKSQLSPVGFKNWQNISTLLVNINYMKKIHFDFSVKDFYFYTPANKQKNHLLFANFSYKQLFSKGKIRATVELNNITNKKQFANQSFSATQYREVSTVLIPFYTLAKIEFLL